MTAFCGVNSDQNMDIPSRLDDSIEEMASRLLDDTNENEMIIEHEQRLSNTQPVEVLAQLHPEVSSDGKALPKLPQLLFNGDNAWAMRSSAVVTASGNFDQADFVAGDDSTDSCPPPIARVSKHTHKSSPPPLPRKSSRRKFSTKASSGKGQKRKSSQVNGEQSEPQKLTKRAPPTPMNDDTIRNTALVESRGSEHRAAIMKLVSKAAIYVDDSTDNENVTRPGKSRSKGPNVLSKMKHAISERLHDSGLKKRQHRMSNEYLLTTEVSQLTDYDEDSSIISPMEKRINEGTNLTNPKIQSLTGHGSVRRKPLTDDAKSAFTHRSNDDPFYENLQGTKAMEPTRPEGRRMSEMSFDQSLELKPSPIKSSRGPKCAGLGINAKGRESTFVVDFDSLISSSPLAQSTPRIRLEPTFEENGGKKLRHVPAGFHSVFDTDGSPVDTDSPSQERGKGQGRKVVIKRNSSQVKEISLGVKSHTSKRRKKHPSPSKAELEGLEAALKDYSPQLESIDRYKHDELAASFGQLRTGGVLQSKDKNALLKETAKQASKGKRLGLFAKGKSSTGLASMAEPVRGPGMKVDKVSMIPKVAGVPSMKRRIKSQVFRHPSVTDTSLMDTDELQWDVSACNIQRKGV